MQHFNTVSNFYNAATHFKPVAVLRAWRRRDSSRTWRGRFSAWNLRQTVLGLLGHGPANFSAVETGRSESNFTKYWNICAWLQSLRQELKQGVGSVQKIKPAVHAQTPDQTQGLVKNVLGHRNLPEEPSLWLVQLKALRPAFGPSGTRWPWQPLELSREKLHKGHNVRSIWKVVAEFRRNHLLFCKIWEQWRKDMKSFFAKPVC